MCSDKYSERRGKSGYVQYHEVKINIELAPVQTCYWAGTQVAPISGVAQPWVTNLNAVQVGSMQSSSIWVDYIYLDTDERRRFAQVSHEYLIEQLQFTGDESVTGSTNKIKLNFNHPCKELVWVVQPNDNTDDNATGAAGVFGKQWFNFTDSFDTSVISTTLPAYTFAGASGGATSVRVSSFYGAGENPVSVGKLQLNGHDRFYEREGRYFNLIQPYQHHENIPAKGVNVYSFAIKPEEHQPSGTCNMSRIDNATLQLTLTDATVNTYNSSGVKTGARNAIVKIFAVNYNVLRIMSGMGGLAYSNWFQNITWSWFYKYF